MLKSSQGWSQIHLKLGGWYSFLYNYDPVVGPYPIVFALKNIMF